MAIDNSKLQRIRGVTELLHAGGGCLLIVLGFCCLIFQWPWGAMVGAVLILAGVVSGKTNQPL